MTDVSTTLATVVSSFGGQERPGQVVMAEKISEAFANGEHLLVQAGTGTGKSLAYLVPALLHDDRVVIATATLALQNQLVTRDLPAMFSALNIDEDFAVVKGRSNYACLHRVREGVAESEQGELIETAQSRLGSQVLELREWAEDHAEKGTIADKDSAPPHVDLAWKQISVTARECLGAERCPYSEECFAERARAEAERAKIVITNHAVLAIDAIDQIPLLPSFDTVVIDEAHELVARVTQAATRDLSPAGVDRMTKSLSTMVEQSTSHDLLDESENLREELSTMEEGRINDLPDSLRSILNQIATLARTALSELTSTEVDAARQMAKAAMTELRSAAESLANPTANDVVWLSTGSGPQLHIAPLDVARNLAEKLFEPKTAVLTSATLQIGGGFDLSKKMLGLDEAQALDVGSPFDYPKQGILYIAAHLPAPGRDGPSAELLAEIVSLLRASGGRALGLFSSRRVAEDAAGYVREQLPELEVLCQGDAQLSELTRRFLDDETTSLFGTLSLWQGLDAPGDGCRLVIIDRIPFPRPDDPIMSARAEHAGPRGFMEVSATHAALLLAQGAGRLIRRSSDRGVVAVLDSRLAHARYAGFLIKTMPDMWRTSDPKIAVDALQRLGD